MITGTFNRNHAGQITSFEITGHAGFGEEGEDIICAAASSLAYSALNSIDKLADFQPIVEINEVEGGYLYAEMLQDISQEQNQTAQILLEGLIIGFQTIEEDYSNYLKVQITNN